MEREPEPEPEDFIILRNRLNKKGIEVSEAEKKAERNQKYKQNKKLQERYDNLARRYLKLFSRVSNTQSERYEDLETEVKRFIADCDVYLALIDTYINEIRKEYIQ